MDALENFDWKMLESADTRVELLDRIIGSHIPMPDGSQHYIELPLFVWYWAHRTTTIGTPLLSLTQQALDAIAEADRETGVQYTGDEWNAEFTHVYQTLIMAGARGIEESMARDGLPLFG